MNKRLIWNFEINTENLLDLQALPAERKERIRWEGRFFWPEDTIITLHGLNSHFLDLSNYKAKHRHDSYFLLPDCPYNIKSRRLHMLYKPLLEDTILLQGYGEKIDLEEYDSDKTLTSTPHLNAQMLLQQVKEKSVKIEVEKEAFIYKFTTEPKIKLELARLSVHNKIYFSACVEGYSQALVAAITKHLLGTHLSCDYVTFLKQIITPS